MPSTSQWRYAPAEAWWNETAGESSRRAEGMVDGGSRWGGRHRHRWRKELIEGSCRSSSRGVIQERGGEGSSARGCPRSRSVVRLADATPNPVIGLLFDAHGYSARASWLYLRPGSTATCCSPRWPQFIARAVARSLWKSSTKRVVLSPTFSRSCSACNCFSAMIRAERVVSTV